MYYFRDDWAIKSFSMEIHEGETVILTGPSGSGKSTIVYTILGLVPHFYAGKTEGKVIVNGKDIHKTPIMQLVKDIGYIPQRIDSFITTSNVYTELAFSLEYRRFPKDAIREKVSNIAAELDLTDLLTFNPQQISEGEKQKVCVGAALVFNPKIIVADEPLSNLDLRNQRNTLNLFKQLQNKGYTIIIATHDVDKFSTLSPRVIDLPSLNRSVFKGEIDEKNQTKHIHSHSSKVNLETKQREYALRIDNISFHYSKQSGMFQIQNISLNLPKGKIIGIVGDNGSGKTTLLRLIAGLLPLDRGKILINGKDSVKSNWKEKSALLGMAFQNPELQFFEERVEDELTLISRNLKREKIDREKLLEALRACGLEQFNDDSPFSLSEGQKRRLAYLSVIMHQPEILLLDEITNGMDQDNKNWLAVQLQTEKSKNRLILISSHDWDFLEEVSDEIVMIKNGSIAYYGSSKKFFEKHKDLIKTG